MYEDGLTICSADGYLEGCVSETFVYKYRGYSHYTHRGAVAERGSVEFRCNNFAILEGTQSVEWPVDGGERFVDAGELYTRIDLSLAPIYERSPKKLTYG